MNNGRRLIAKHKRAEFSERGRPQVDLDPTKRELLANAEAIALEWVTPMRLEHVIDAMLQNIGGDTAPEMYHTGRIIERMVEDVYREAEGEIVTNPAVRRAIRQRAAQLFKQRVQTVHV